MDERLEERLDRWVSRGRRLVDGVSGTRPGSRAPARPGERRGAGRGGPGGLGRWMEDRLDWLLEDGDDWREPWEEPAPDAAERVPARPRRPLEAISRRGRGAVPPPEADPGAEPRRDPEGAAAAEEWPDDADFSLPRWRRSEAVRPAPADPPSAAGPAAAGGGRPLPRSSRRR
ncbi:MAG: RNA helicase [Synechococcaceae cyanobacterium]|nr:RNA helicase [Synechococcaceae cyanobacterium]